jgi:type I restriction enzyme S subunit
MTAQQLKNAILQEMFLSKENWEEKELRDIVSKQCPISYGIVQQGNHVDGGVPVVRPVDLHCKYVARDSLKCTSSDISESYSRTILRGDEILLCVRGTTGILALATKELKGCNVNRGIVPLFFDDEFDRLFFYYQLQTPTVQEAIANNTMGSALRQINIKDLRTIKLSYPPLAEQKRIVAKIEELLPKVEEYGKAQESLDKLNEELPERLKKSILQEAIEGRLVKQDPNDEPASALLAKIREEKKQLVKEGKLKKKDLEEKPISEDEIPFEIPESWEWCRMTTLFNFIDYRGSTPTKLNYGIPLVTAKNVKKGYNDYSIKDYISPEEYESRKSRGISKRGDLLFTTEAPLGNVSIADLDVFSAGQRLITLQTFVSILINNTLMMHFMLSDSFQKSLQESKTGTTVAGIKASKLKDILIPLPPLAEQKRIVEKIEQLFKEIDKLKK